MPVDPRYRAPTVSPRLDTLDVLSVGMSLDVFRQGQVWQALQEQSARQPEARYVGSILPIDTQRYPQTADDKDLAYEKRQADALELGLRDFLEKWPIPTITAVRGWDPQTRTFALRLKERKKVCLPRSMTCECLPGSIGIVFVIFRTASSARTPPKT
ncbi:hypothetical protein PBOI14_39210 [Pseudomonas sp. Boi14]|nr:hypothetical protein PBOI14_39210 [Pseudomonas sp. Boi14]